MIADDGRISDGAPQDALERFVASREALAIADQHRVLVTLDDPHLAFEQLAIGLGGAHRARRYVADLLDVADSR